jgi:hypothetical protein
MYLGSDATATVTVTNPQIVSGANRQTGSAGLFGDKLNGGGLFGGDFSMISPNIVLTTSCQWFSIVSPKIVNVPTYQGGSWTQYNGLVNYEDPATGWNVTGTPRLMIGGFTLYVDGADGKLKARGPSSTVTTLAGP